MQNYANSTHAFYAGETDASAYTETCSKCHGTGKFISYAGRVVGDCFACAGEGSKSFKTAPETRAKARGARAARSERNWSEFWDSLTDTERDALTWLVGEGVPVNDFLLDMADKVRAKRDLTPNMINGVVKWYAPVARRAAQHTQDRVACAVSSKFQKLVDAFNAARESGIKKPIFRAEGVTVTMGTGQKWGGFMFLEGEFGQKLGTITPSGELRARAECTDAHRATLDAIADDPFTVSKQYGKRTGNCGCCGRELTNALSIELGIGPICREKWGF
jgi:hypothetical protein